MVFCKIFPYLFDYLPDCLLHYYRIDIATVVSGFGRLGTDFTCLVNNTIILIIFHTIFIVFLGSVLVFNPVLLEYFTGIYLRYMADEALLEIEDAENLFVRRLPSRERESAVASPLQVEVLKKNFFQKFSFLLFCFFFFFFFTGCLVF